MKNYLLFFILLTNLKCLDSILDNKEIESIESEELA